ncbi:sperm-associated antigen 5 [Siniperca chuatsi]|uniref:sperm-associated antigen 5 n=1 Tax=Siniperca chuatsi TaxID=119488 RepID=UPI001CE14FE0|nr:sperm-associated antigen 5 [Siniperca chuatsi]
MSTRKSSSSGEGLPSSRCWERTPLRSMQNEMLHLSTPSRFKSKSLLNADVVKMTKGDVPLCDPETHLQSPPSTKVIQTNAFTIDMTTKETACRLGDVTFKSFICPGGEVEITGSSVCAEEIIILPKDQAMKNTWQTEDTVISDSIIVRSCSDNMEHPYYNLEMKDASLVDIDATCLCEISNTTLASGDVTWKSFVCDGGEVEVSDVTRLQDETIPLPKAQLGEPLQDNSVNSTTLSDCQQEHADHPYCSSENGVCITATFSETTRGSEESPNGLSDVTFKSFNCTGGEIEIPDETKLADETVPVLADQTVMCSESYNYGMDPSLLASDQDVQNGDDHLDHPYCNIENGPSPPSGNLSITQEPLPFSLDAVDEVKQISLVVPHTETERQEGITFGSFISARSEAEKSDGTWLSQKTSPLPDDQAVICQPLDDNSVPTSITQDRIQDNYKQPNSHVESSEVVVDTDPPAIGTSSLTNTSLKALENKSINCHMQETSKKDLIHPEDSALPSMLHRTESSDCRHLAASAETPTPVEVHLEHVSRSGPHGSSEAKDSALVSSRNGPVVCNSAEKPHAENLPDVLKVLSECPSEASALQFGILSPVVRRASLFLLKARKDLDVDQFLANDSALEGEKSLVAPVNADPAGFWTEHLESPMPRPLFNSTALGCKPQSGLVIEPAEDVVVKSCAVPQSEVEKPLLDIPLISDGPLQQQLRQMAEFLFLASGKMGPAAISAPVLPPAAVTVPSVRATPAESHSVCVGTTPMKWADHSVNTSGQFERKRDFSVVDSCTLTDPLLWNVPPGSLECLPRQELEQRLTSSMIMVEALVQQLTAARTHGCPSAGPAPSDLREKLVQTDHTELSQTTMHRDLYLEALSRIGELELDGSSLQNLIQCMQDMMVTMTSLSCDTDAALSNMKQIGDVVREDHQSLVSHYGQMKSLFERTKETQTVMMQKVKDAFHQRDDMKIQMEEAFTAKEASFSAMEQLRTHCATEILELERLLGSQQELLAALNQTYPEQIALNQAYSEVLNSTSDVLSTTMEEQSSLMKEHCTVRGLLQKTAPILLKLNDRAAAALRERDEHISARDQAVEERDQIEEELNQTNMNLQTAREQIGDLNLQVTILTSEMGVLRQMLTEREEERGQLERKVTELSATVSSTLASYTFLEQALAAESTKLQQSWKDIQLAKDRANELETSLGQSEQRVCEFSQALAQSEEQLSQLQALSQSQNMQIQQLQDVCTQLSGVREMNEFLQMENELAREQMAESERMLRANLQGLRERNIQCEDLKGELGQLQFENRSLQEELETTRSRASATQLELGEKLGQAVTEITLLHHTLRGLTNELHAALNDQKPDPLKHKESQLVHNVERSQFASSFVDSIMVALTAEKEEDVKTEAHPGLVPSDLPEPQCETLFSEMSAFTRIASVTPKKNLSAVEFEPEEDQQSSVAELFADLGSTVTELISTLKLVRQRKDAQLEELHNTICALQGEHQAANSRHEAEVHELKRQVGRLNSLAERGNHALQQKAQDEKTVTKLMSELQETQEILNKHKTDSNELRKEVVELRRSLQQSKVESQFLHGELRKAGGQSANPAHFMEEKIQLLKEVERLKLSLQEVEQARVKLLDRAKRHQIIHQTNQQKSENELQMLNNMINKVRETLLSLPDVVKNCDQLQQLVEYIG